MQRSLLALIFFLLANNSALAVCSHLNVTFGSEAMLICNQACGQDDCYLNIQSGDVLYSDNACLNQCSGGSTPEPVCGNHVKEEGEACDDGNTTNGDGCSSSCQKEKQNVCIDMPKIYGPDSTMQCMIGCGVQNCFIKPEEPENLYEDNACQIPCVAGTMPIPVCGNGIKDHDEDCDDGNTNNGDGCSDTCQKEEVIICTILSQIYGSDASGLCNQACNQNMCYLRSDGQILYKDNLCTNPCSPNICGNGSIDSGEQCDDGNTANGDGCSSTCTIEPFCGDGIVNNSEQCDDGNTANGDGCSSTCTNECTNAELIVNGDFENPTLSNGSWNIYPESTSGIGWKLGWKSSQTSYQNHTRPQNALVELHRGAAGWLSNSGNQHAELDSDWDGPNGNIDGEPSSVKIYQDITTIPNQNYTIDFAFSARPQTDEDENSLEFKWNNIVRDTISASNSGNQTSWTKCKYNFTASSNTTRIEFADLGEPNTIGTFIDSVSVKCGSSTAVCGNGILEPQSEQCDDGNTNNGDGCNSSCQIEIDTCSNPTIYAIHEDSGDDSTFFKVNLNSQTVTKINKKNNYDIEAIDAHPVTGVIYALAGDKNDSNYYKKLIILDKNSGIPDVSTGVQLDIGRNQEYAAASFNPVTNELWASGENVGIRKINLSTGNSTVVTSNLPTGNEVEAMTWDTQGQYLYLYQSGKIYKFNPVNLSFVQVCSKGDLEGMRYDPDGNLVVTRTNNNQHKINLDIYNLSSCSETNSPVYDFMDDNNSFIEDDIESFTFICE